MVRVVGQLAVLLNSYDQANPAPLTGQERDAIPACNAAVATYYDICGWGSGWRSLDEVLRDMERLMPSPDSLLSKEERAELERQGERQKARHPAARPHLR